MSNQELLDTRAAADLLDVDPRTLEAWRHRGQGPRFLRYNGRAVRYRRIDVEAYIAESLVERPRRAG